MEGQGRSRKVKEGHGWSLLESFILQKPWFLPITGLTFQVRKVRGGGGGVGVWWWPVVL